MKYLRTNPLDGKPFHFYHYFGALQLPVLEAFGSGLIRAGDEYGVCSCGIMDRYTYELGEALGIKMEVVDSEKWSLLLGNVPQRKIVDLASYDRAMFQDGGGMTKGSLRRIRKALRTRFNFKFDQTTDDAVEIDVLLIGRKEPDPFYAKKGRRSGSERRSITNEVEIEEKLRQKGVNIKRVFLEDYCLKEKGALLQRARILVLQHGAALQALWFMKNNTSVIEILPRQLLVDPCHQIGEKTAELCNLDYSRVIHAGMHADVNIDQVIRLVRAQLK